MTNDCCEDLSNGIKDVADGGDGGALGPKEGMVVGMLLILNFRCVKDPKEGMAST